MAQTLTYHRGAALPSTELWLLDDDGTLVDLSAYTMSHFRIGTSSATVVNKTSGITGAAGAGSEPDGTPNCVIAWDANELDIAANRYTWNLAATSGGKTRKWSGQFHVVDVLPDPA